PKEVLETEQPRLRRVEVTELGHELLHIETPALDHQVRPDRLARERRLIGGDRELQVMARVALVARDHGDARSRVTLEPLATRLLVVARIRERYPEASSARRLERPGAHIRRVRVGGPLEFGHGFDD